MIQDNQLRQDLQSEAEIVLEDYEYAFEMIKKYPHLPLGTDQPYSGIENLRPETETLVEAFMSWH